MSSYDGMKIMIFPVLHIHISFHCESSLINHNQKSPGGGGAKTKSRSKKKESKKKKNQLE